MRVLIDLTSLADHLSGIERFALNIAKELIKDTTRRDISYILLFKNEVHKEFQTEQTNITRIVINGKNKLLFNQIKIPLALLRTKADYYFFPAFPAPFFFFSRKAVSSIHDMGCWDCPNINKKYMTLYFKIMYWKAAFGKKKIVTVSEFSKERISKILKKHPSQIVVIYDGLSDCFREYSYNREINRKTIEKYKLPKEYLLCFSTLEPRKNMRLLMEAYDSLLNEEKIDIDLVLAGRRGWLVDDLLTNINKNTIERIHFTGFIEDDFLPYVYKNACLFIFPSIYEGFGMPPVEAMAMGVPVVSSDAAALPEILGNAAFLFQSGNCRALKEKIFYVLQLDDGKRKEVKKTGKEWAYRFCWRKEALKLRDMIFI